MQNRPCTKHKIHRQTTATTPLEIYTHLIYKSASITCAQVRVRGPARADEDERALGHAGEDEGPLEPGVGAGAGAGAGEAWEAYLMQW